MTARLNDHDWELISAYIDRQLSPSEMTQIEQRLQSEPALSDAYSTILRTRKLLQAYPRIKRRINFYLTYEMVRPRIWRWLVPALDFSSAAAAVLAILFLVLDFIPINQMKDLAIPPQQAAPQIHNAAPQPTSEKQQLSTSLSPESAAPKAAEGIPENNSEVQNMPVPTAVNVSGKNDFEPTQNTPEMPVLEIPAQSTQPAPEELSIPLEKGAPAAAFAAPSPQDGNNPEKPGNAPGLVPEIEQKEVTGISPATPKMETKITQNESGAGGNNTVTSGQILPSATQIQKQPSSPTAVPSVKSTPTEQLIERSANPTIVNVPWFQYNWIILLIISIVFLILRMVLKKYS